MFWNSASFVEGLASYLCAFIVLVLMRKRQPSQCELPAYIYLAFASGLFISSFAYTNWAVLLFVAAVGGLDNFISKQIIGEDNSTTVITKRTDWILTIIAIFGGIGLFYAIGHLFAMIVVLVISLLVLLVGSSDSSANSSK